MSPRVDEDAGVMRVVLVDDSPALRESLRRSLSAIPGLEIAGEADCVDDALDLIRTARADLIVLDVDLGAGGNGINVLRYVAHTQPQIKVVVLSNFGWSAMRSGFMRAGAAAYFDKGLEIKEARDWIERQVALAAGRAGR